jgi:polysaccharide biosynthesis protein PslH
MKVLVLTPRFPERPGKGDQIRAFAQITGLASGHEVIVVTPGRPSSPAASRALEEIAEVHAVRLTTAERGFGGVGGRVRDRPAQLGWMMPPRAHATACLRARSCDVSLVSTIRALPAPLPGPVVLDHIDAMSRNMVMRARTDRHPALRLAALLERGTLARHEHRAAQWLVAQIASSQADADALPASPPMTVIPQGWDGPRWQDPPGHVRDIDVIFTGNMDYPPNADAARRLAKAIAPALQTRHPAVRVCVVGRAAAVLRLKGVEVASDVDDLYDYLRRAKIAVAPLRGGTGCPTKLIEAAAAGAAVVAPEWAAAALGMNARRAETAEEFVEALDELLTNEPERRACAAAAGHALSRLRSDRLAKRLEQVLVAAADR